MTILPENQNGAFSEKQMQRFDSLADDLSNKMLKKFVGNVASGKDDIIRDLVLRAQSLIEQRLNEKIGNIDNPFLRSAANTTLNYSKQQATSFLAQQLSKFNKFI